MIDDIIDDDIEVNYECPTQYICVIDFEATCVENIDKDFYPHEIIEFPAVLINTQTCSIVDTFHSFVKPIINPKLSEFCKSLTGISQETVNNAETFDLVFPRFLEWLYSFAKVDSFTILTDGSYDMTKFLYLQCLISHLEFPSWAERFIDIKLSFKMYNNKKEKPKLIDMLESYGLTFKGQLHSGKDDAYNIAQLVLAMLKSKCYLACNAEIYAGSKKYLERQLSTFFRKKRNEQRAKKREAHKKKKEKRKKAHLVDDTTGELNGLMDIDPDLIGSENTLMKHKSK